MNKDRDQLIEDWKDLQEFWAEQGIILEDKPEQPSGSVDLDSLPNIHIHSWRPYHGLLESYQFCEICDAKKAL